MLQIEAFRPFFVSLNLLYSVVRGEQVALQANVFNYMAQDMDVSFKTNIVRRFVTANNKRTTYAKNQL